jgi:GNAT superfamily N-acetyltransferase
LVFGSLRVYQLFCEWLPAYSLDDFILKLAAHSGIKRVFGRNRMNTETGLREATVADVAVIVHHRRAMFREIGYCDEAQLAAMAATSAAFIKAGLESGSYRGWLAETDTGVVAGGGLVIVGFPSGPRDPNPRRVWILNMYTEPEYRRRGLARSILQTMIDWCRKQGFRWVSLHASDAGRHLYESLGFEPTSEMRLMLK